MSASQYDVDWQSLVILLVLWTPFSFIVGFTAPSHGLNGLHWALYMFVLAPLAWMLTEYLNYRKSKSEVNTP